MFPAENVRTLLKLYGMLLKAAFFDCRDSFRRETGSRKNAIPKVNFQPVCRKNILRNFMKKTSLFETVVTSILIFGQ